jgi:hypothetical protein
MFTTGTKSFYSCSIAGLIMYEALSANISPQPAILEHPHLEVRVEVAPICLDVSSPAPSGGLAHKSAKWGFAETNDVTTFEEGPTLRKSSLMPRGGKSVTRDHSAASLLRLKLMGLATGTRNRRCSTIRPRERTYT